LGVRRDGMISAGLHEVSLDASGLSSGVYYYRMHVEDPSSHPSGSKQSFVETKKLVVLK
jgi:hypothetical protein